MADLNNNDDSHLYYVCTMYVCTYVVCVYVCVCALTISS